MTTQLKRSTYTVASIGVLAVFMAIGTSAKPVKAETFSVDSTTGGMALNTNNQFRKIDGQPRMAVWPREDNDSDQQFDRLPGNLGGTLLKQRSTGKCLNAHYLRNGAELNVWNCNANDPDQNFTITDLGGNYNQIKRTGTNLCVDSPTRTNGGKVHLWECNPSNPNQRWKTSQAGAITLSVLQRLLFSNAPSVVTSPYGYQRCDIWSGVYAECKHLALDIASSWRNPPIYSPVSGEVIQTNSSVGKVAVYNAKANVTFFFYHMNTVTVRSGQVISVGTQVGTQGRRGYATGDHLHFEARSGRTVYMATSIAQTINPVDGVNRTR